jgi:branched-chain amino acid aminotransferase
MPASTFTASAIQKIATKAPAKIASVKGAAGPVFGSRLFEVNYTVKNGWETPVLRDYGPLKLAPQISALHYGLVVFDHLVVSRDATSGKLLMFRPEVFLARLARSRNYLHFAKYDDKELLESLKVMVREDEPSVPTTAGENYLLRTTMIGNNNNLSAGPADEFKLYSFGTVINSNANSSPLKLKADASVRRSWRGGTGEISMGGNYANQIYHERQSREQGFDRHLWLVDDNAITTAGDSNFFAVFKRDAKLEVVTPALDGTMMPGVMRDTILRELAKRPDVTVTEGRITADDLADAARNKSLVEAFSTSSASVTRSIGNVWFNDDMLNIPTPADGIAAQMKREITRMQTGAVKSEYTVEV